MNRRKAIALIAASTVAGVACAVGAYAAVTSGPDQDDNTAKPEITKSTATKKPAPTTKAPTATAPTPSTPTKSADLSVDNILRTSVLTRLGYPIDVKSASRYSGDLQYVVTPCVKESMDGLSSDNVFSGSWPTTDGGMVSESITAGDTTPIAESLAEKVVGWHKAGCGASSGGSEWTVGPHHRTNVTGGWTDWVELRGTGDDADEIEHAAVLKVDDRIAVLGVATTGHSEPVFLQLLNASADALR